MEKMLPKSKTIIVSSHKRIDYKNIFTTENVSVSKKMYMTSTGSQTVKRSLTLREVIGNFTRDIYSEVKPDSKAFSDSSRPCSKSERGTHSPDVLKTYRKVFGTGI